MKQTTLYFGTQELNGIHVTYFDFYHFLVNSITPRFSGYTVINATGFWKGDTEPTYIVIILHEGVKVTDKIIDMIRKEYKELFNQESVLRVDSIPESVSL